MEFRYNDKSYTAPELKREFPNTSICFTSLPDGVVAVLATPKPTPTTNLKTVVRDGVTTDANGNTVEAWIEKNMFNNAEDEANYLAGLDTKANEATNKEVYAELDKLDLRSIRAIRSGEDLTALEEEATALRAKLV